MECDQKNIIEDSPYGVALGMGNLQFPDASSGAVDIENKPDGVVIRTKPGRYACWLSTSHSQLGYFNDCQRRHYLLNDGQLSVNNTDWATLKKDSKVEGYAAVAGHAVHGAIQYALESFREKYASDGRLLSPSKIVTLKQIREHADVYLTSRFVESWNETGKQIVEHIKRRVQRKSGVEETKELFAEFEFHRNDVMEALNNWYDQFFIAKEPLEDPLKRYLIPQSGFSGLHPGLLVEIDEKKARKGPLEGFEGLLSREDKMPSFTISYTGDLPFGMHRNKIQYQHGTIEVDFKVSLDFMYLAIPERGEVKIVVPDWKTNKLDLTTGLPHGATHETHLDQLKGYAIYIGTQHNDIFDRYRPVLERVRAERGLRFDIPSKLERRHIELMDVCLKSQGLSPYQRIKAVNAADLNLDQFWKYLKNQIRRMAQNHIDIRTGKTELKMWEPVVDKGKCRICNVAAACDEAPENIKREWGVDG